MYGFLSTILPQFIMIFITIIVRLVFIWQIRYRPAICNAQINVQSGWTHSIHRNGSTYQSKWLTFSACLIKHLPPGHLGRVTATKGTSFQDLTGPQFNIKMTSYQYRKSHCGDNTILRPSYLHNGISYSGKMTSLYWIRAQDRISISFCGEVN